MVTRSLRNGDLHRRLVQQHSGVPAEGRLRLQEQRVAPGRRARFVQRDRDGQVRRSEAHADQVEHRFRHGGAPLTKWRTGCVPACAMPPWTVVPAGTGPDSSLIGPPAQTSGAVGDGLIAIRFGRFGPDPEWLVALQIACRQRRLTIRHIRGGRSPGPCRRGPDGSAATVAWRVRPVSTPAAAGWVRAVCVPAAGFGGAGGSGWPAAVRLPRRPPGPSRAARVTLVNATPRSATCRGPRGAEERPYLPC